MSHFITAVITKNPSDYHKELAPFQENNMCDCPKEYLEFVDKTEEFKKEWQEVMSIYGFISKEDAQI